MHLANYRFLVAQNGRELLRVVGVESAAPIAPDAQSSAAGGDGG
jgi:hypothetical protein